jgi:hypothetical protein
MVYYFIKVTEKDLPPGMQRKNRVDPPCVEIV